MLYLKINFGKEIHLLTKKANFNVLSKFIKESFKSIPRCFEITYCDSDGDNISICNDEDMETLYTTTTDKFVKVTIIEAEQNIALNEDVVKTISSVEKLPKAKEIPKTTVVVEPIVIVPAVIEKLVEVTSVPHVIREIEVPNVQAPTVTDTVEEIKKEETKPEMTETKELKTEKDCRFKPMRFPHSRVEVTGLSSSCPKEGECQFPGKEFFKEKLDRLLNKKIETLMPCIINKVKIALEGKEVNKVAEAPDAVVHSTVKCDGCEMFPLVGIRYKCSECRDFDFCEKCEATLEHSHTFLKIKKAGDKSSPRCHRGSHGGHQGGHHGGHVPAWKILGQTAKRAFKLAKRFGGEPETYREFVERTLNNDRREIFTIWAAENNIKEEPKKEITEERIAKRCQKLSFIFR